MLIVCPNCATSYQVDAPSIGGRGRSVRCLRCQTIWFAAAPADVPVLRTPEAAANEAVNAFRAELGTATAAPAHDRRQTAEAPPAAIEKPPAAEPEQAPAISPEPAAESSLDERMTPGGPAATAPAPAASDAEATAAPPGEPAAVALADIPIPVEDAPPLAPGSDLGGGRPGDRLAIENNREDIESAAIRRRAAAHAQRQRGKRTAWLPVAIAALLVVCVALLAWRKDAVRHLPQLASFYASIGLPVNLRGLTFTDLKVGRETHDGVPVLVVEGTIASGVAVPVEVPRLRFALRNSAGAEVYAWTAMPSQSMLEPGAKLPFRSRLASPPDDGHDVEVRFFTRRDAVVGLH
jgi:predicted Zn finger-like uncharacterized protein